jgi:hypothetical protein
LDSIRIVACHVLIREKNLPSSYFIIFSLPNIYTQIKLCGMVIGDATTNITKAMLSPA